LISGQENQDKELNWMTTCTYEIKKSIGYFVFFWPISGKAGAELCQAQFKLGLFLMFISVYIFLIKI
jgi:hypothetical protein